MIGEFEIAFASVKGMGIELAQKILDVVSTEKEFFSLSQHELELLTQGKNKILSKDYRNSVLEKAKREMDFIEKNNINVHYFKNSTYPTRLFDAVDAPIILYSKGDCNLNSPYIISIVGTRNASQYGKSVTEELIAQFAKDIPNVIIVSGLAYGIDICAHRAAMANSVSTVGVLAHGLNTIYPAQHRNSAVEIIKNKGLLLTDYMSQDAIHRSNFLARNRIVAAIADCTIVIESAIKGGALVTATIANSYNRDVFAVPGRINDEYSKGCNALINQNKAALLTCADDLYNLMRWNITSEKSIELSLFPEYTEDEQKVINLLKEMGEVHINIMANILDMPMHRLLSMLVDMEFSGYIKALPGSKYTI
ncbi:MAG: DNA-processing protein DprA [Muribaculaceae bacterium]|nr:DNA-processing protein DprA [Muribaculaceae bacterium]